MGTEPHRVVAVDVRSAVKRKGTLHRAGARSVALSCRVCGVSLLLATVLLFLPGVAMAHELDEEREVLVSVDGGSLGLLLAWTLPAGSDAERVRAQRRVLEWPAMAEEARTSLLGGLLLPRMWRGVTLERDGEVVRPVLEAIHVRDASGGEPARGMVAMAVLRVELGPEPEVVRLTVEREGVPLLLMVQLGGGARRSATVGGDEVTEELVAVRLAGGDAVEIRVGAREGATEGADSRDE